VWTAANIAALTPKAPARKVTVGRPIPPLPAYDHALQSLGPVIEKYAGDPDNPWAIAHGILARGIGFLLADGREAVPHLFASFAEPRVVGAHTLIGFPRARGTVRVEPHTDLLLKNMAEVGLDPDARFATAAGGVPAADLYRWTVVKSYLVPKSDHSSWDDPNDIPWGAQALATWAPDPELQWVATDGTPMDMDDVADFLTAVVVKESAFMVRAMETGESFERKGQALFGYTCGGAHLVQGTAYVVARGFGRPADRPYLEKQAALLYYRLPIELGIYDEALKRNPKYRTKLLVQRVKFLGHWLETMSKLQALGLHTPTDAQLRLIEGAAQNLTLAVGALEKTGVFSGMEALRSEDEQLYLDVIGDSAHAVRGLELALGRQTLAW
jgi:hypothetical protein